MVLKSQVCERGPDAHHWSTVSVSQDVSATLYGFVLHLRGQLTRQPLTDHRGNTLLWNGEVFDGLPGLQPAANDTEALLTCLSDCDSPEDIVSVLSHIQGPWAFIYWQESTRNLWFGRDVLGRRSLLWHLPQSSEDCFILSSIKVDSYKYTEVPAVGIFHMEFGNPTGILPSKIVLHPWKQAVWPQTGEKLEDVLKENPDIIFKSLTDISEITSPTTNTFLPSICRDLPPSSYQPQPPPPPPPTPENGHLDVSYLDLILESNSDLCIEAEKVLNVLGQSVKTRILNQVPDSLLSCKHLPSTILSKSNVSHKNCSLKDVTEPFSTLLCEGGTNDVTSLQELSEELDFNQMTVTGECLPSQKKKISEEVISLGCKQAEQTLSTVNFGEANVAILFSGGLDAAVIAALADRYVEADKPIDLLNVAFAASSESKVQQQQQQQKKKNKKKNDNTKKESDDHHHHHHQEEESGEEDPFLVPDRLTGYTALEELNRHRTWNFVEINVTKEELQEFRERRVSHLLYPLCSVLDDSIGCAVWFASRGVGVLGNGPNKGQLFYSRAKVVLCGMGADELFAGYTRHRAAFSKASWPGLIQEMQTEVNRISSRNLGRDDRVISDHGREARFPYLDEKFLNLVAQIPAYKKVDLTLGRGVGEKLLLRTCARKLGFQQTAVQPKRAIQFGSRIAKLENSKEKAGDVCIRLKSCS
ncbi:asparagine synthetase domain-containing protein 1-like [Argonauta hians]